MCPTLCPKKYGHSVGHCLGHRPVFPPGPCCRQHDEATSGRNRRDDRGHRFLPAQPRTLGGYSRQMPDRAWVFAGAADEVDGQTARKRGPLARRAMLPPAEAMKLRTPRGEWRAGWTATASPFQQLPMGKPRPAHALGSTKTLTSGRNRRDHRGQSRRPHNSAAFGLLIWMDCHGACTRRVRILCGV